MQLIRLMCAVFGAALLASCGCGFGGGSIPAQQDFVDLNGTVTLPNGQPMKRGVVHFFPEDPAKGRADIARVEDGKFYSKMVKGRYGVKFDLESPAKSEAPKRFTQQQGTSPLTVEVSSGTLEIKL